MACAPRDTTVTDNCVYRRFSGNITSNRVKDIGFYGGVPLGIVDRTGAGKRRTLVLSPLSNFLSTTLNVVENGTILACGVQGAASRVPVSHTVEMLLSGDWEPSTL